MAKLGEGDARWIVTDRADGKNVNSWHWEERDLTATAHESLKARLKGLALAPAAAPTLTITEITDLTGDVTVAQRKGKIMCYFELKFAAKWKDASSGATGKLTVAEVDHDTFTDDYEITVSATESNAAHQAAEGHCRATGRKALRAAIVAFFQELFAAHNVGSAVGKASPPASSGTPTTAGAAAAATVAAPAIAKPKPVATASGPSKSTLDWKMRWRVPIGELFSTLIDDKRATAYTRSPAQIDPRPSGAFSFLGGVISGYFVSVDAPTGYTMQWRLSSWPSGVFSTVVVTLTQEEPALTVMSFAQAGIPEGDLERVRQGWQLNFFDAIKMVFGFAMEYV